MPPYSNRQPNPIQIHLTPRPPWPTYRGDGNPALKLAGRHVVASLNLDRRAALRRDLADGLPPLADDGTDNRVVHEHDHAPGLFRRARQTRRAQLADGRELK